MAATFQSRPASLHGCARLLRSTSISKLPGEAGRRLSPSSSLGCRLQLRGCTSVSSPRARLKPPWRVLYFGTDSFSVSILEALHQNRIHAAYDSTSLNLVDSLEVVVNPNKCPVRSYALSNGIKINDWPTLPCHNKFDVGVLASFGRMIPERVIKMFPYGILNVHPSILPRWRGATPIPHTILHGDKISGVSIMEIAPKHFDVGPILLQEKYPLWEGCTALQLSHFLAIKGSQLLLKALQDLPRLEQVEKEQESSGVTYAPKVHSASEVLHADIASLTSCEIDRKYRAFGELYDLKCNYGPHSVKLRQMLPVAVISNAMEQVAKKELSSSKLLGSVSLEPGTAFYSHQLQAVCIRCQDGWVAFGEIVLKKPLSALAFSNGYLSKTENENLRFTCLTARPLLVTVTRSMPADGEASSGSSSKGMNYGVQKLLAQSAAV